VISFLSDGPKHPKVTFVFAHGAGAPMDSPFMESMAKALAGDGVRVLRFEFPYMRARRESGARRAPDREPALREAWTQAIGEAGPGTVAIGGKSMGGRIASMVADEAGVAGLLCFGYPFHPPGAPDRLRTAHLAALATPALVLQGTRDPFGGPAEVSGYRLSPAIRVVWVPDGDHSFKPRAKSGRTEAENLRFAAAEASEFLSSLAA
jgi:uncharacterized protein